MSLTPEQIVGLARTLARGRRFNGRIDPDDATQIACEAIIRQSERLNNGEGNVRTFAYNVGHTALRDSIRSSQRSKRSAPTEPVSDGLACNCPTPEQLVSISQRAHEIRKRLYNLVGRDVAEALIYGEPGEDGLDNNSRRHFRLRLREDTELRRMWKRYNE